MQSESLGQGVRRGRINLGITGGDCGRKYVPKMAASMCLPFYRLVLQRDTDTPPMKCGSGGCFCFFPLKWGES